MCTVTWRINADGYQVLFNRDEQRTRSIAMPPNIFTQGNTKAIMPIDPDGHGSWIACNDSGLTICLLNYYQGATPENANKSRGQLIRDLAYCHSKQQLNLLLEQTEWSQYPPFTLVIFDPQSLKQSASVASIVWDGIEVKHINQTSPLTSSSFKLKEVQAARKAHYQDLEEHVLNLEQLMNYHTSHQPQQGAHSVCMHREDAHTVSLTVINIKADKVSMDYHQGSPCQTNSKTTVSLARKVITTMSEQ